MVNPHGFASTPSERSGGMFGLSRLVRSRLASTAVAALLLAPSLAMVAGQAGAAKSDGCEGGGFTVDFGGGTSVSADGTTTIPAAKVGQRFLVAGRYVEFTIVSASFGIENWLFTGEPNPEDITGRQRTVVWAAKTPDHKGLTLTGNVVVNRSGDDIVIQRQGAGLSMKIQAKDCAAGGIFQMEVQRGDGTRTLITHILAEGVFYYDNPNFRAREGDQVPFTNSAGANLVLTVAPRINIGNKVSADFVGRDSPQVADRVLPPTGKCVNDKILKRDGTFATVLHCGGISQWNVASGGRMGWVTGEDATEVAPPATNCVSNCQAQNRVRGGAVVLGNPFPVPDASKLKPRFP
jgi:hypothetical protein